MFSRFTVACSSSYFLLRRRNPCRFGMILVVRLFFKIFCQTYCNSAANRVYYLWRLRKAIVCAQGAERCRSVRDIPADFSAARSYPLFKLSARSRRFVPFIAPLSGSDFRSEQFGWQHGAYSSHLRLDGYAFFIPGEKFSYII